MNFKSYLALANNPQERVAHYQDMVRQYFDFVTDHYRRGWGESFHFGVFRGDESIADAVMGVEALLMQALDIRQGMRVLDVGCGIGGPARNIARKSGACITGLNISEKQLDIARHRTAEAGLTHLIDYQLGDAMDMPFEDSSFDAIYILEAGCHMPDKRAFIAECARVLKADGAIASVDWAQASGLTDAEVATYIEPILRLHAVPHLATLEELHEYLEAANLHVITVENLSNHGNILRNWEVLQPKVIAALKVVGWVRPVIRMLADGALFLMDAARAGAFILAFWHAVKSQI